ncbi:MAG: hypothetical protein V4717_22100 [Bacteroidota bacterium]
MAVLTLRVAVLPEGMLPFAKGIGSSSPQRPSRRVGCGLLQKARRRHGRSFVRLQ